MQSAENNNDFLLENLFNVKDKVVVITGESMALTLSDTQSR